MMPAAMENRNDVFITDHGSNRDSRNRALRVRRAAPGFGLVLAESISAPDFAAATAAVAAAAVAAPTAGSMPVLGSAGVVPGAGIWVGGRHGHASSAGGRLAVRVSGRTPLGRPLTGDRCGRTGSVARGRRRDRG